MKKLSDTATTANWDFLDLDGLIEAFTNESLYWGKRLGVEPDDLFQEAVLFLAVRPAEVRKDFKEGGVGLLTLRGRRVMRDRGRTENAQRHEPYEVLLEPAG